MTEKHPNLSQPTLEHTKKPQAREILSTFGKGAVRGAMVGVISFESMMGIRMAMEMDDPSAGKVAEHLARFNIEKYYEITRVDLCPAPMDPADITIMHDTIIQRAESPAEIAIRHNLELPDASGLYDSMSLIVDASNTTEVTDILNKFAQTQMGITLHADQLSDVDLHKYKNQTWELMMIMRDIPTTLLDKLEIKDIHIMDETYEHLGGYDRITKDVYLNINHTDSPSTVLHEIIGHGVHNTSCEGIDYNDHRFTDHNPSDFEYAGNEWQGTTPDPYNHPSRYATKNPGEDYAETASLYFTGEIEANLVGIQSPLDKKVGIILERLNQLAPGSAEYLSSVINQFSTYERFHKERIKRENEEK